MTSLERIKDLQKGLGSSSYFEIDSEDARFLFKAFQVMRKMAIDVSEDHWHKTPHQVAAIIDEEFEERMKK